MKLLIEIPKDANDVAEIFREDGAAKTLKIENLDGGEVIRLLIDFGKDAVGIASGAAAAIDAAVATVTAIKKAIALLRKEKDPKFSELRVYKDGELLLSSFMSDAAIESALKNLLELAAAEK